MLAPLILGIDIGTLVAAVVVADTNGRVMARANQEFAPPAISDSALGYSWQAPDDWWKAVRTCLHQVVATLHAKECSTSRIVAGAVNSTSGSIVLLDAKNQPVQQALMDNGSRTQAAAPEIDHLSEVLRPNLGYLSKSTFALPKIVWLMQHEPQTWEKTHHVIHVADYIVGKLTRVFDVSSDSLSFKTGFDLLESRWPSFIESELGIDVRRLPRVVGAGEPIAPISKECAAETGLDRKTLIVAGMRSGAAEKIASGAHHVGDWNTVLGSRLTARELTSKSLNDPFEQVYCYPHRLGFWMTETESIGSTDILDHHFSNANKDAFKRATLTLSPTGLSVYPLLQSGKYFPFERSGAIGFIDGEPMSEPEFYVAHLEGIAFTERLSYETLKALGAEIRERVYTSGNPWQSTEWMQIRSDVMNLQCVRAADADAAMGSAIIAASRTLFENIVDAGAAMVHLENAVNPRPEMVPRYEEAFQRFLGVSRQRGYLRSRQRIALKPIP